MKKLVVGALVTVAVLGGTLAAPAAAAPQCSTLFCYQYGTSSGTVWTNVGPLGASVTVQAPVWAIVPRLPTP